MKKGKRLIIATVLMTSIIGSLTVNAATMSRSMNWVLHAVTITNSYSDTSCSNKNILTVYSGKDKTGSLLASTTSGEVMSPAVSFLSNTSTKSAYAKHTAIKSGTVVKKYTYTKNKGTNYSY